MIGSAIVQRGANGGGTGGSGTDTALIPNIFLARSTDIGVTWTVDKIMNQFFPVTRYTVGGATARLSLYDPLMAPVIDTTGARFWTDAPVRGVLDSLGIIHVLAQVQSLDSIRDTIINGRSQALWGEYNQCIAYWNTVDSVWGEVTDFTTSRDRSMDSIGRHFYRLPGNVAGIFAKPSLSVSPDGQTMVAVWQQAKVLSGGSPGAYVPDLSYSVQITGGSGRTTPTTRTDIMVRASSNGGRSWGPIWNVSGLTDNSAPSTTNLASAEEPSTADFLSRANGGDYLLNLTYLLKNWPGGILQLQRPQSSGPAQVIFRQISVNQLLNGVSEGRLLPSTYQVAQNYPNPFGMATTIAYELPSNEQATLRVFDMLGKEVRHIAIGRDGAVGQVQLAATGLQTGVYRYRVETKGGWTLSRQMVIVK